MLRFRIAAIASASLLGLGIAAPAFADGSLAPVPTVSQATGGSFTVDLPGVGSLSFTVDPTTGVISNVLATADTGFTAGTPAASEEGVQVSLTSTGGTVTLLQAEVNHEDGTVKVQPEAETDQPDGSTGNSDHNASTTTTDAQNQDSSGNTNPSSDAQSQDSSAKGSTTTTTDQSKDSTSNDSSTSTSSGDHGDGSTTTTTSSSTTSTSSDGGSSQSGRGD